MIKAVIFDLGSVLTGSEWLLVYGEISKESKIPEEKVREVVNSLFIKWSSGKIDEDGFWKEFEIQTGVSLSKEFTKDFFLKTYKEWSKDIKESWEILVELKAKGIRLALLSNTIEPHVLANEEMGRLEKLRDIGFEAFIWSYEEGFRKPDPRIYKVMLAKLNLPAEACAFVDDDLENVEAAKELGMRGIHFQAPEQLRKDLTELGLLLIGSNLV